MQTTAPPQLRALHLQEDRGPHHKALAVQSTGSPASPRASTFLVSFPRHRHLREDRRHCCSLSPSARSRKCKIAYRLCERL